MKRRHFLSLGFSVIPYVSQALALDYRKSKPGAWAASSIDSAATELYGREKFATIQKSAEVELSVPKVTVGDPENIIISIRSSIKGKTISIFQDANPNSLLAVFYANEYSVVEYELCIRMESKGTVFAVVEGVDEKLYYARQYIDVLSLSCMSSGE